MKKLFVSKSAISKIALILVIIILFQTVVARPVEASSIGGTLLSPIVSLIVALADGVISILQDVLTNAGDAFVHIDLTGNKVNWLSIIVGVIGAIIIAIGVIVAILVPGVKEAIAIAAPIIGVGTIGAGTGIALAFFPEVGETIEEICFGTSFVYANIIITPETLLKNQIAIFDVNFFQDVSAIGNDTTHELAMAIRGIIGGIYRTLRDISIMAMLIILVYIAIRALISLNPREKSKYKESAANCLVGLVLILIMHFVMSVSTSLVTMMTEGIVINDFVYEGTTEQAAAELQTNEELKEQYTAGLAIGIVGDNLYNAVINEDGTVKEGFSKIQPTTTEDGRNKVLIATSNFLESARYKAQKIYDTDPSGEETKGNWDHIGWAFAYIMLVILTVAFVWMYAKRLLYMAALTMFAPIVGLMYPINKSDGSRAQTLHMWLKEYMGNLVIQPFHLLLYTILIGGAMHVAINNAIYVIVAITAMTFVERLLKDLIGIQDTRIGGFGDALRDTNRAIKTATRATKDAARAAGRTINGTVRGAANLAVGVAEGVADRRSRTTGADDGAAEEGNNSQTRMNEPRTPGALPSTEQARRDAAPDAIEPDDYEIAMMERQRQELAEREAEEARRNQELEAEEIRTEGLPEGQPQIGDGENELDTPIIDNPGIQDATLENPELDNLESEQPVLEGSNLDNSEFEQPVLEDLNFDNAELEQPQLETPELGDLGLEQPVLENPELQVPSLESASGSNNGNNFDGSVEINGAEGAARISNSAHIPATGKELEGITDEAELPGIASVPSPEALEDKSLQADGSDIQNAIKNKPKELEYLSDDLYETILKNGGGQMNADGTAVVDGKGNLYPDFQKISGRKGGGNTKPPSAARANQIPVQMASGDDVSANMRTRTIDNISASRPGSNLSIHTPGGSSASAGATSFSEGGAATRTEIGGSRSQRDYAGTAKASSGTQKIINFDATPEKQTQKVTPVKVKTAQRNTNTSAKLEEPSQADIKKQQEDTAYQKGLEEAKKIEAAKQAEAERKAQEEAARQAEAERKAQEEAERQAEAERRAQEEATRQAEADRIAQEEARQAEEARRAEQKKQERNAKILDGILTGASIAGNVAGKAGSIAGNTLEGVLDIATDLATGDIAGATNRAIGTVTGNASTIADRGSSAGHRGAAQLSNDAKYLMREGHPEKRAQAVEALCKKAKEKENVTIDNKKYMRSMAKALKDLGDKNDNNGLIIQAIVHIEKGKSRKDYEKYIDKKGASSTAKKVLLKLFDDASK